MSRYASDQIEIIESQLLDHLKASLFQTEESLPSVHTVRELSRSEFS